AGRLLPGTGRSASPGAGAAGGVRAGYPYRGDGALEPSLRPSRGARQSFMRQSRWHLMRTAGRSTSLYLGITRCSCLVNPPGLLAVLTRFEGPAHYETSAMSGQVAGGKM